MCQICNERLILEIKRLSLWERLELIKEQDAKYGTRSVQSMLRVFDKDINQYKKEVQDYLKRHSKDA